VTFPDSILEIILSLQPTASARSRIRNPFKIRACRTRAPTCKDSSARSSDFSSMLVFQKCGQFAAGSYKLANFGLRASYMNSKPPRPRELTTVSDGFGATLRPRPTPPPRWTRCQNSVQMLFIWTAAPARLEQCRDRGRAARSLETTLVAGFLRRCRFVLDGIAIRTGEFQEPAFGISPLLQIEHRHVMMFPELWHCGGVTED